MVWIWTRADALVEQSAGAFAIYELAYKAAVQHSLLSKSIRLIYYAKWIKHADDTKASCAGTNKTPLASFVFSPKAPLQPPISCPSPLPPQKPLQNRTNQHTRCKWDRIQERNIWREAVTRIFASPLQCAVIIGNHCDHYMEETEGERTQYTLNKSVFSHTFLSFLAKRAGDAMPQHHSHPLLNDWFLCCPPTLSSVRFSPSAAYISSVLPLATRRIPPQLFFRILRASPRGLRQLNDRSCFELLK